jgi:hypothetical protein
VKDRYTESKKSMECIKTWYFLTLIVTYIVEIKKSKHKLTKLKSLAFTKEQALISNMLLSKLLLIIILIIIFVNLTS